MATAEALAEWRSCPRCGAPLRHEEGSVSCPSCGLAEYAGPAPTASAVIVDGEGRILLARRATDPGRGLWDLVGGFVDEGESGEDALRRELEEETGVAGDPGAFLGAFPDRYGEGGAWTFNLYWEVDLASGAQPSAADDVAELAWFPRAALPAREEFAFANTIEALERAGARFGT
ncbi:MAG TPA: NUDIX domain-containing protein [Gaiellaceae bacterium]|nr:NUDIX domain-containing protein [Gaiellaceae bacterium]